MTNRGRRKSQIRLQMGRVDPRQPAVTLGLREDLRLKFSESQVAAGRLGCDRRSPAVNHGLIVA